MSYQALYRKYRPKDFSSVRGQEHIVKTLTNQIQADRIGHAYLFCGTRGTGKTTVAKIFAKAVNCENPGPNGPCGECAMCKAIEEQSSMNVVEIDAASNNRVDDIRQVIDEVQYSPAEGRFKVYIIDEVHMLSTSAFNALLKTLEEPPSYLIFILATTEAHKIPLTILSRCQVVPFRTIPASEAAGIIVQNTGASREQARMAVEACDGSITRAVEFLKSNERLAFRTRVLEVLGCLRKADDWDAVGFASELVVLVKAPLDVARAEQEQELAENADFLAKSAIRQIEARNKRQLTAKTFESLRQLTAIVRSWLRDVMAVCAETPELVINVDARASVMEAAEATDEARAAAALAAVRRCDEAISYNVSPETCIDALLFETRDALYRPRPPAGTGAVR